MASILHCTYTGATRVEIRKEGTQDILHTAHDEKNQYVTPGDMLGAALGTCTLTMMSVVAEKLNHNMDGTKITVTPVFGPNLGGLAEVSLQITFPDGTSEDVKARYLAAAKICPVHKSLHPDIKINIMHN